MVATGAAAAVKGWFRRLGKSQFAVFAVSVIVLVLVIVATARLLPRSWAIPAIRLEGFAYALSGFYEIAGTRRRRRRTKAAWKWAQRRLDRPASYSIRPVRNFATLGRLLASFSGAGIAYALVLQISAYTSNPPDTCVKRAFVSDAISGGTDLAIFFSVSAMAALIAAAVPSLYGLYKNAQARSRLLRRPRPPRSDFDGATEREVTRLALFQTVLFMIWLFCFGFPFIFGVVHPPTGQEGWRMTPKRLEFIWGFFELTCRGAPPSDVP